MAYLPVTAVTLLTGGSRESGAPLIAAGVGRCIEMWTAEGRCIHRLAALPDGPINGMVAMRNYVFVYGHSRYYACVSDTFQDIVLRGSVTDRILAVHEDPSGGLILLVLAHGQVLWLCPETGKMLRRLEPAHDALLYSACILECTGERIVIALGTVFSGIEMVQVDRNRDAVELLGTLDGPEGHRGSIFALAHRAGGSILASASDDRMIKVWDWRRLVAGTFSTASSLLATFHGHKSRIWDVAVGPDSSWVLSAGEDGTLRQWSIHADNDEQAEREMIFGDHQDSVRCIDTAEINGKVWMVSGGDDCSISLRNLPIEPTLPKDPIEIDLPRDEHRHPKAAEIMSNGALITVLADGTITGIHADIAREATARNAVTCLFDDVLLVGTLAGVVFLWAKEAQETVRIDFLFKSQVTHVAGWRRPSSDRIVVLAQAGDGSAAVAEILNATVSIRPIKMQATVICSSLLFNDTHVILGTRDGGIIALDVSSRRLLPLKRICTDAITCIRSAGPTSVVITDRSGCLSSYTVRVAEDGTVGLELLWQHRLTKGWLEQVDICSDGRSYLVAGFRSTRFFLTRVSADQRRKVFATVTGGAHRIWRMRLWEHADRFTLAFIRLGKLYRYDGDLGGRDHGDRARTIKKAFHSDSIRCIRSLDTFTIVTGGEDGWLKLSRVSGAGCINVVGSFRSQASSNIKCIATWKDKFVFTGGSDGELRGWKVAVAIASSPTLSPFWCPAQCTANGARIMDMDLEQSADDSLLLVLGYSDSHLAMYRLTQGEVAAEECLRVPAHQGHCVLQVKFLRQRSVSGKALIVSGGTDGLLQLHSLDPTYSLSLVSQLQAHQSGVNAMAMHPSQPLVISGGDDGKVSLVSMDLKSLQMFLVASIPEAHRSTITGLCWLSEEHFLSVAVDQRVIVWRMSTGLGGSRIGKERQVLTQVADAGAAIVQDSYLLIAGAGIEAIPIDALKQT